MTNPPSPRPSRPTPSAAASSPARPAGAVSRRPRAPQPPPAPKKKLPIVPILGGVAVLTVGLFFWKLIESRSADSTDGSSEKAHASADPAAAAPKTPIESGASGSSAGAAPPAAPPAAVKLDRAAVEARLAEAATAADAIALGEKALADTGDETLAESCFQKALELDPANADAKRELDVRAFDPKRELAGLDDLVGTPQTWMIQEFLDLEGRELSRGGRAREIARWEEARKTVAARAAEADSDPFLTKIDKTRSEIAKLPFFKDLQYDVVESTRPYALFVEVKGESLSESDQRREAVEEAYAPFLAAYDKGIHNYLWKLSPKPPRSEPTFIVFVLLDVNSYQRYFKESEGVDAPPGVRAHYEPARKRSVTYSPKVDDVADPEFAEGTQVLLHELTHAWVDQLAFDPALNRGGIEVVQTHWFSEGIAEYMSCQFLDAGTIQFQPWRSMRLTEFDGKRPEGMRIPMQRAFKISTSGELGAEASMISADPELRAKMEAARIQNICQVGFYADMSLFMFWLNYANDGKYKKKFEDYVRLELRGNGGGEVAEREFPEVFALPDIEATVDEFQKAVVAKKVTFKNKELSIDP